MSFGVSGFSDDELKDVSDVISENIFDCKKRPASLFIEKLFNEYPDVAFGGLQWGFGDTVVREMVVSRCCEYLVGIPAPTYGDKWSAERSAAFAESLIAAYDIWEAENLG